MASERRSGPSSGGARRSRILSGWALLAPSLFGIVVFLLIPIVVVAWLSTQHWDLIGRPRFVGLDNWISVLSDPSFTHSLLVTAELALLVIPLQTALGLLLAALLSRRLPGSAFFRVVYVIPWVCAPLALGIVWKWIFAPTGGALNALLGTDIAWLTEPSLALPAIAAVNIWSQVGYISLFFMAGLASIPDSVIEAARVDGASPARIFWSIKLPLIRPTLFFVLVTTIISVFQVFDSIYALTEGGPGDSTNTLAYRVYDLAFTSFDLGRAGVTAMILFVILVAVTLLQQLWFRRRITYDLG